MTMFTSVEAINAEFEYRRESVRLASRPVRRRRSARKERARQSGQVQEAGQVRRRRADGTGWDDRPSTTEVPAQRTSESGTKSRQPA